MGPARSAATKLPETNMGAEGTPPGYGAGRKAH
jgi:hypothetical protein